MPRLEGGGFFVMQAVDVLCPWMGDRLITWLLGDADGVDAVFEFDVLVLGGLDCVHFGIWVVSGGWGVFDITLLL